MMAFDDLYLTDSTADRAGREPDRNSTPKVAAATAWSPTALDKTSLAKARRKTITSNAFTDAVGRYVPANAREVWHVVFRFTDAVTFEAEVRVPDIAARLGCACRTVERGLDWLMTAGLITRIRRGTRQLGPSRYLIDADPARHVGTLRKRHEELLAKPGRIRKPMAVRAVSGRFSTRQR
jgi:hypothetical protein